MAEADVRRVERIVRNLVTNAIDHADPSGVDVRLATDGRATALTVRDHGVGLQPGQSAMVFNRFWRGDPARARTTGGTGLGLAIALEDARLHGGWLQAWGTPGGGAQFRLTLPRRAGDPLTHSPLPLVPAGPPRGGRLMSPRLRALAGRARSSLALCGLARRCTTLPESGPVHRQAADRPDRPQDAPYFNPPGPAKDATPSAIVSGFLVAMQANPLTTSVARKFLSERARRTWQPNRGTIVYEDFNGHADQHGRPGPPRRHPAARRARRLARRRAGALARASTSSWSPRTASGASTTRSTRWWCRRRSSTGASPGSTSTSTTRPAARCCPTRCSSRAVSRRRPTWSAACSPVPDRALAEVSRSALPSRTDLDLSVLVTESGVAEVPLSREILQASPSELSRAVDQLALDAAPGPGHRAGPHHRRRRAGAAARRAHRRAGHQRARATTPAAPPTRGLWGLRGGRVVDLASRARPRSPGPSAARGYSMRSLAVSESPRSIAAISTDGTTVFVAPVGRRSTWRPGHAAGRRRRPTCCARSTTSSATSG